jgi:hypothetical protein
MVGIRFHDVFSQLGPHVETRFVNRDSIHDRIRTSKVNIFKDARRWAGFRSAHTCVAVASVHVDEDGFTGVDITIK